MGNRLQLGNLSPTTTPESIRAMLSAAGVVREVLMDTDRATGKPRGTASVIMDSPQAAMDAAAQMNGSMLDGHVIRVSEAPDRPSRPGGGATFGGGGGGRGGAGGGGSGSGNGRGGWRSS